jgi:branched-chain amino acid transport system ATP-binding protein
MDAPVGTGDRELRASGVTVRFAGLTACEDIELAVRPGEILGLIGPNGAGKTTLTNVLTGFQRHAGTVAVDGRDVTGWSPQRLSRFGVRRTFQNVRLFAGMTVAQNLEAAALGVGLGRAAARRSTGELLERFDLTGLAGVEASALPYGLERRLGIARALVGEPRYVVLDEPAAGLNEEESDELLDRLRAVPEQYGCGLVVIEHDMRLIMRLCDRLHVIDHGRTLATGDPAEVRADPAVIEAYLGSEAAGQAVAHG